MVTLQLGSKGSEVKTLQNKLNIKIDGVFGNDTEKAVREFQKRNNLEVDGIVGHNTWNKLGISNNKRNIKEIIVHCSATPEGIPFTVSDIRSWHVQRGFSDIGYHYVVYLDGSVHVGRNEGRAGAHCTNHNAESIGVCYIGGCTKDGKTPKDTRTNEQKKSLINLLKDLKARYPKARIYSHNEFANKACPSFDATKEYKDI